LLGLYYVNAWWQWNGRQAFLFDLPARKFYVLGVVFWPQDFIFLTGLLIIAAMSLFFFTALAGRVWCGYACPQTVWTEVFLWMERVTEGDRAERMKLDAAPWSWNKLARKSLKQFLWVTLALWSGFTFVGYFTPIRTLSHEVLTGAVGGWELFWILFYGLATYGNAGYLREQVCKYMCPYEPRGPRRRGADPKQLKLGSCIDCTWCVQVCPTGIDIREGLQQNCIACAACIDACDSVMDKMQYPRGLIRYSTQHSIENKPTHILRPRVVLYCALLLLLVGGWSTALWLRKPVALDVIRDRNALYRLLDDGRVENVYDVKIINKSEQPHRFRVSVTGPGVLSLDPEPAVFTVGPGEVFPAGIRIRRSAFDPVGSESVRIAVRAEDDPKLHAATTARFLAPAK
jgi:polyferredoxin